jgi:hypothetical protein
MELSLLRSLMNKDFYEDHRGARCPDRLFSKDARTVRTSRTSMVFIEVFIH